MVELLRRRRREGELTFLDAPASPFFFMPLWPRGATRPMLCGAGWVERAGW